MFDLKGNFFISFVSLFLLNTLSATPTIDEQLFNQSIHSLKLKIDEGNIVIKGHDNNKTEIEVRSSHCSQACQHTVELKDEVLTIINKKNSGGCKTDYDIYIPQHTSTILEVGASDIDISNMKGKVEIEGGMGQIKTTNIYGEEKIKLGTGAVTVFGSAHPMKIRIGSGNIKVTCTNIPANPIKLDLNSGVGKIHLSLPLQSRIHFNHDVSYLSKLISHFPNSKDNFNFDASIMVSIGKVKISKIEQQ